MDALAILTILLPLAAGWTADLLFGDPARLPHPVVGFGKIIAAGERRLNKGRGRTAKGAVFACSLVAGCFASAMFVLRWAHAAHPYLHVALSAAAVFYCLAGTTLIREVRRVFAAVETSTENGRKQLARIVGRDTSELSPQQIRKAALETLAENLSDGVIAPLFWFMLAGIPGMFAYKMVNTLDSMIGYRNERYRLFGRWAARIDDAANYIPARITAALMIAASGRLSAISFVRKYGRQHASPNSGYPEAALAGIIDCRFGGPASYFGQTVNKPYIGTSDRELTNLDMERAIRINRRTETLMIAAATAYMIIQTTL
ncbi:MAG: adenosylcobinamide-phosphate synthase CbiB [Prevotellaceae bacterium]|jgi:adenosylcobinamide-phosphate synthase|nr:adenosylcobinamide-phosphate synthase CbiB [Prevotellaceae bacterium]